MAEAPSETEERRILLTASAARRIATLKTKEDAENAFLRIAVSGGGCSGFQYGLSFDEQRNDDDLVFERDGVGVVIDEVSLGLLNGAEDDSDLLRRLLGALQLGAETLQHVQGGLRRRRPAVRRPVRHASSPPE